MAIEIDYSEVAGKKVECPPQCGMCCLCQPEVLPEERAFFRTKYPKCLVKTKSEDQHFALAMKKGKGSCVFLNGRRCDIYQNRTTFCRQFPFHFHVSDRVRVELDLSCRGVWSGNGTDAVAEAKALAEDAKESPMKFETKDNVDYLRLKMPFVEKSDVELFKPTDDT